MTPSPDLSHVALGVRGGTDQALRARPKPRRTLQPSETFAATGPASESSFLFRKDFSRLLMAFLPSKASVLLYRRERYCFPARAFATILTGHLPIETPYSPPHKYALA